MILLTNTLTGSAADKTKATELRGVTLQGRGGIKENLRPHTTSAEFSTRPDVLVHMQVGNLSLTPLFSRCGYVKICLMFHGNVLFLGSAKMEFFLHPCLLNLLQGRIYLDKALKWC